MHRQPLPLSFCILLLTSLSIAPAVAAPFVAWDATADAPANVVIYHNPDTGAGFKWARIQRSHPIHLHEDALMRDAAWFVQDALEKITGATPEIVSTADLSQGIVLVLKEHLPADLAEDPAITEALAFDGHDDYNANEAFYIRTEPKRVVVTANRVEGLLAGVDALLESVGYEVLWMGPHWIDIPDVGDRLVFDLEHSDRPDFYLRRLTPTSGQFYGVGTLGRRYLEDRDDIEPVEISWRRCSIGYRIRGRSMPGFPGHALQGYHQKVLDTMREHGDQRGFLRPKTTLGPDGDRPEAGEENRGHMWINTDASGEAAGKVYICDGQDWKEQNPQHLKAGLDITVDFVRQIIFEGMKRRAVKWRDENPRDAFIMPMDPEDGGGYAHFGEWAHDPDWYAQWRKQENLPFGKAYVLHGFKGIEHPRETWDPDLPANHVFGLGNWLLHEFDQWVQSLPEDQQATEDGRRLDVNTRVSLYSYNYHDVPPDFNLDPRIRVMIASYPKHRGTGRWQVFQTYLDVAQAFKLMLPREPSGNYAIISLSYYHDWGIDGIGANWSTSAASIADNLKGLYAGGVKAMSYEIDFNGGKLALGYYLLAKQLWDVEQSAEELDALRDRWIERAYGAGAADMQRYHDFMLLENYPVNAPNTWARAVRRIDAASKAVDSAAAPRDQQRIDHMKAFWYFYYLLDTGQATRTTPAMQAFAWKGQLSYTTAMHMVIRRVFGTVDPTEAAPQEIQQQQPYYAHEQTRLWWDDMLAHWPYTEVTRFEDTTLSDGTPAAKVDLRDGGAVAEFADQLGGQPFIYNAGYQTPADFLTRAAGPGDEVGFYLWWPDNPGRYYRPRDFEYGLQRWNPAERRWDEVLDKNTTTEPSVQRDAIFREDSKVQFVEVRHKAPIPGTYRFLLGRGGNASRLASLGFDLRTKQYRKQVPMTFFGNLVGHTQAARYIYIPKGTKSVDLEVWDDHGRKRITFYKGREISRANQSRTVDLGHRGTFTVEVKPEETGCLAKIESNGFAFPYMYSIPQLWSKVPAELLIPRAIAEADGLTIIE